MKKLLGFLVLSTFLLLGCNSSPVPEKESVKKIPKEVVKGRDTFTTDITTKEKSKAILKLDTGGHRELIKDMLISSDSSEIITSSDDKTIRVWDAKSGKEKRKILGEIGLGNEGKVFAIALSKDDKYLATGGMFVGDNLAGSAIRIYEYSTGKLIKVLKSHTNVINDLAFSEDGKYLISASSDATAKIWNVSKDFKLQDTIKTHKDSVYAAKIIEIQNRHYGVTASYDGVIALYDMQQANVLKRENNYFKLKYLAITKINGGQIALCGFANEILLYDFKLNFIKKIKISTRPEGLAYSKDGKYLISGSGSYPRNVNVYSVQENYKQIAKFKKHTNLTMAVGFLDDKTAVSAGGDNNEIYIWI